MSDAVRIAVLASGGGSNFQALVDRFQRPDSPEREVVGVIASREGAGVLERARRAGVASAVSPPATSEEAATFLRRTLDEWRSDIVVLAGYMKLVPEAVVRAYWGRVLNIHPALLPSFGGQGMYGARVHRAVIDAGVRITGATVHFVDEAYDRGPILCQWPVPVLAGDTPESVAARVLTVEHRILPAAVEALASGAVRLEADRRVRWVREWFETESFTNREG
ncbi:phosphoribosylglycinamide formyltransferase [Candidatus Palauibacter polyketidifaciens]|uniref:phosphoribosylglycinamide formyltransferase n=1 Tax=Candidatus Palauibacter polyketidifaciens TaxID=3056740 RepID=UPI00239BD996|nr:phosphoribosylglycinamide formyltransferase [Candidatus Palauibacter polyketidifaciens]MDE2719616.1 phosphoribosylglycinamide formyltransferase [Candidatus Palauibacter polyketidifaciens]